MRPTLFISSIVAVISVASGCTPEPKKAERTVEQYLADKDLMNKKVKDCANNPGDLSGDPDCINAIAAAKKASHKTLRDLYREPAPNDKQVSPSGQ